MNGVRKGQEAVQRMKKAGPKNFALYHFGHSLFFFYSYIYKIYNKFFIVIGSEILLLSMF